MNADANRATSLRFYQALDRHDLDAVGPLLADDYVYRNGPAETDAVRGRDAFLAYEQQAFEAFPDLHLEVLEVIADSDRVAARLRATGTHLGEFLGIPASGRAFEVEYANISRFDADGRIVEDRDYVDNLALLQQLGILPANLADPVTG
jgi:C-1 hydroxylase